MKAPKTHFKRVMHYTIEADGDRLRKARLRAKLSLKALAAFVGCSSPFLHDLEHGRRGCRQEIADAIDRALRNEATKQETTKP